MQKQLKERFEISTGRDSQSHSAEGRIFAVIASHNRAAFTLDILKQLAEQTVQPDVIILVDDASTDGTVEQVKIRFPLVRIVRGPGDWFWCRSMHMGVREVLKEAVSGDSLLMLNDDLQIRPDFVERLLASARLKPGCVLHAANAPVGNPDVIQFGGMKMNWVTVTSKPINRGRLFAEFAAGHCEPTDLLWGRGLLVPVEAILKAGNYSWRIPHRGDNEFALRLARYGVPRYVVYDVVSYVHDDELEAARRQPEYQLSDFRNFFFGVRSIGNLHTAFWTAMGCSSSWLYCYYFLIVNVSRLMAHFFVHVRPSSRSPAAGN